MPPNRLPLICGCIVCAIVVLGIDARPAVASMLGIIFGGIAMFFSALATRPKTAQSERR